MSVNRTDRFEVQVSAGRWLLPVVLGLSLLLTGCGDATGPGDDVVLTFDFDRKTAGWTADFVDFPEGRDADVGFEAGVRELPDPLDGRALFHRGLNISDDLFMYFKRRETGLEPGTPYRARFEVEFVSDVGEGCDVGVGPNVFLKAGASRVEPVRTVDGDGNVRLSVDKGNQRNSGDAAVLLGDIRNGEQGCGDGVPFATETVTSDERITVTADEQGGVWLLFGSESAFEVAHELFFTQLVVELTRVWG